MSDGFQFPSAPLAALPEQSNQSCTPLRLSGCILAYADKLDGKIRADFWERKMSEWRTEEQEIEIALNTQSDSYSDRVLSAKRILELANRSYFLYVTQEPPEQAKLLRMVLSNCSVDAVSLYPT